MVSAANLKPKTTTVAVELPVLARLNREKYQHSDETLNDTIDRILREHEEKECHVERSETRSAPA